MGYYQYLCIHVTPLQLYPSPLAQNVITIVKIIFIILFFLYNFTTYVTIHIQCFISVYIFLCDFYFLFAQYWEILHVDTSTYSFTFLKSIIQYSTMGIYHNLFCRGTFRLVSFSVINKAASGYLPKKSENIYL